MSGLDPYLVGLGAVIIFAVTVVGWIFSKIWPQIQKLSRFLDDVTGEPERPGIPSRPGIMERLARVEGDVGVVKAQVQNSHRTNLRDDLDRLQEAVRENAEHTATLRADLTQHIDETAPLMPMLSALHEKYSPTK